MLLRLAYPKFDLALLAWAAFVPLFFALEQQRYAKAAFPSFIAGFVFFLTTIFWLHHVTVAGMFVMAVYLSMYFVVFGCGLCFFMPRLLFWQRLVFVPALWVVLEFVRGHFLTGFPWALLGYSQTSNLAAIQAADVFGAYGVSFIVMFVNVWIFEMLKAGGPALLRPRQRVVIPFLVIVVWLGYGLFCINAPNYSKGLDGKIGPPLKVALVQGNIPQELKWAQDFSRRIFDKYALMSDIVQMKEEPDFIIWPETSFPDYLEGDGNDSLLRALAARLKTPLLLGAVRFKDKHFFNSAVLFSGEGEAAGVYDKLHLVPFGEYLPARRFLPFLERILPIEDFTPGRNITIFRVAGRGGEKKFAVLICFEDIFSDIARWAVARGADFLVNITNDAWFGDTSSPYQHMQASVFRAVENRVFVVRSANTGVSCVIDETGRVLTSVKDASGKETFVPGYAVGHVYRGRMSPYRSLGDFLPFLCGIFVLAMTAQTAGKLRGRRKEAPLERGGRKIFVWVTVVAALLCFCGHAHAAQTREDQRKELSLHYYRGIVNFEAGRYDAALTEFQNVAAIDPYYRDVAKRIEGCIKVLEDYRENVLSAAARKGDASPGKAVDLYFLGKSYYEKGDYLKALEAFRAVLEKNPGDKFAGYYAQLCRDALPAAMRSKKEGRASAGEKVRGIDELSQEISYIKSDIKEQEDTELFLRKKAERRSVRDELIRQKERQLKEQEGLLEEERQDFLAHKKISQRAGKIKRETEKWRKMKERLSEEEPGFATDLTEYPAFHNNAENYYAAMQESLRQSRWNSAALNAISSSITYCDALLIYFYNVRSASPRHENICRLLLTHVQRSDVDEPVFRMRSLLNLKKLLDDEERPANRTEALFAAQQADKIAEWCKSVFP